MVILNVLAKYCANNAFKENTKTEISISVKRRGTITDIFYFLNIDNEKMEYISISAATILSKNSPHIVQNLFYNNLNIWAKIFQRNIEYGKYLIIKSIGPTLFCKTFFLRKTNQSLCSRKFKL